MKDFISNVLPRIQKFSEKLDKKEILIGKPWVLIEEVNHDTTEVEFFRDGRLIVSYGGEAIWGTWQITPSNQRLILDYNAKTLMLHAAFINDAVLVAKKSGSKNSMLFFVNQLIIPDLNVQNYLENISKKSNKFLRSNQVLQPKKRQVVEKFNISFPLNEYDEKGNLVNGFIWSGKNVNEYLKFSNGEEGISKYFLVKRSFLDGSNIVFVADRYDFKQLLLINGKNEFLGDSGKFTAKSPSELVEITYDEMGQIITYIYKDTSFRVFLVFIFTMVAIIVILGLLM